MAAKISAWPADSGSLSDVLAAIDALPKVSLIVVDPLAMYIDGNENDSAVANSFYRPLQVVAIKKQCAVVVLHHLQKGARPVNISGPGGVLDWIRGSGTIKDRPRMILGMYRLGNFTKIAVGKSSFPATCGVRKDTITLQRDDATLRHIVVDDPGGSGARDDDAHAVENAGSPQVEEALLSLVIAAVQQLTGEGKSVSMTGKNQLYGRQGCGLDGLSRAKVLAATKAAVASGRLAISDKGTVSVPEGAQ